MTDSSAAELEIIASIRNPVKFAAEKPQPQSDDFSFPLMYFLSDVGNHASLSRE
jgi:hypothetical protein